MPVSNVTQTMAKTTQKQLVDNIPPDKRYSWPKGVSGNPKGRPPNVGSVTYWYKKLLAENEGLTARKLAGMAVEKALIGSLGHLIEVTDRTEGPVGKNTGATQDNRVINIIVSSDRAKELTELIGERLTQSSDDTPQDVVEGELVSQDTDSAEHESSLE